MTDQERAEAFVRDVLLIMDQPGDAENLELVSQVAGKVLQAMGVWTRQHKRRKTPKTNRRGGSLISDAEKAHFLYLLGDGLPYREIAQRLGRPIGTISSMASDAIAAGEATRRRTRANARLSITRS